MDYNRYRDILLNGEKTEWYGTEVPKDLINDRVRLCVEGILKGIDSMESKMSDMRGGKEKTAKKEYVDSLLYSLRTAPYRLNNDFYLIKKKEIESEVKKVEEKPKPKTTTTRKKTTTTKTTRSTKNSDLIFGGKK